MAPPPHLGVENVKIRENPEIKSGESRGAIGTLYCPTLGDPRATTFLVWDLMTPPPLGVESVKIRENCEKIRGPVGTLYNLFKALGAPRAP